MSAAERLQGYIEPCISKSSRASPQVQFSLLDRRPLHGMLRLCEQHDIHLLTYGSLGGGLLSDTFFETKPRQGILGEPCFYA